MKKMKNMKRIISFLLFAVMLLAVFPFEKKVNNNVKAFNDKLDGYSPISLGDNFVAHIRQTNTGLYVTERNGNVCVSNGVFDNTQIWNFIRNSDGTYTIKSHASNKVMDVAGANYSDGTNIQMYENTGHDAQKFFLYYIFGSFYLKSVGDKTVDVDSNTKNVQLYGCSTGYAEKDRDPSAFNARSFDIFKFQLDNSLWNANFGSEYSCYIRNWHSGLLMTAEGDNVIFKKANYDNNQKWIVTRNEYGGHVIKSVATGKVLDVLGGNIEHGTEINLYNANGSKAQTFFFINTGESRVYIKPSYAATVMDMDASTFEVHACAYGTQLANLKAQIFEIITEQHIASDGCVRQSAYFGDELDAVITLEKSKEALTDGTTVAWMQKNTNSYRQVWKLKYDKNWKAYSIIGVSGKSLDVSGAGFVSGTKVSLYQSNGTIAQKFRFYECGSGFIISPVHTHKIVDVAAEDGMSLQLYDTIPGPNSLFTISPLSVNGQSYLDLGEEFESVIQHKSSGLYLTGNSSADPAFTSTSYKWKFKRQADGSYVIKSETAEKVLDVKGGSVENGTGIQLYVPNNSLAQSFHVYKAEGGYFLCYAKSGSVLEMNNSDKHIYIHSGGLTQANLDKSTFILDGIALNSDSNYVRTNSLLKRVPEGTTASQIISQFATDGISVLDKNGNIATSETLCGTGSKINLTKTDSTDSLSIVVFGDVDGNSIVDGTDYLRIKSTFLGLHKLDGVYFTAGDIDNSGDIDTTDYIKIKSAFLGLYNLNKLYFDGVDAYGDNSGNNVNYLCGIDSYGRAFEPIAGFDETKDVGIFYFLLHGDSGRSTLNITELLKNDPDTLFNLSINTNQFHYWGEPLYGYYKAWDEWVIRRHVEMLINAGIDYLVFDATNGYTYEPAYTALFNVLTEYQNQGWDIPLICFYTNTKSYETVNTLYNRLYKPNKYRSLWYCPTGDKPMIITDTSDPGFKNTTLLNNFYVRTSQWPDAPYKSNGIPWMEWTYPQPVYEGGIINVSVAQHPDLPFSLSIFDRSKNQGRGYDYITGQNIEADMRKGTNFLTQWNTAFSNPDVKNVFVTGWNEWIAQKININNQLFFVDCATEEFSRDIEPMKGGYEDSFYIQLCDYVRKFKGIGDEIRKVPSYTININNNISQWNTVDSAYNAVSQNSINRDTTSVDSKIQYKVDAARNNIQQVKLANDSENLYFYARSENNMQSVNSSDFVNFYFGVGDMELKGWNGYEFVLSCGDKALYKLEANGSRKKIADASVTVIDNVVHASVSLADIGAQNQNGIYFKVTDGINSTDIMDTYISGKAVPMGRLSYYYYFAE